eukprot:c25659_g3_i1 orf=1-318(-)
MPFSFTDWAMVSGLDAHKLTGLWRNLVCFLYVFSHFGPLKLHEGSEKKSSSCSCSLSAFMASGQTVRCLLGLSPHHHHQQQQRLHSRGQSRSIHGSTHAIADGRAT